MNFSKNTGADFIVKFLLIFTALYAFNWLAIGVTDPKNYYNSFIATYLNYLDWLRYAILYTANGITRAIGYNTFVEGSYYLKNADGIGVRMAHACLGCGVMSFWLAFVLANTGTVKQKVIWAAGGIFCIYVINCIRISMLLIAIARKWTLFRQIDHHTLFNICSYAVIFVLILFYIKKVESPQKRYKISPSNALNVS